MRRDWKDISELHEILQSSTYNAIITSRKQIIKKKKKNKKEDKEEKNMKVSAFAKKREVESALMARE